MFAEIIAAIKIVGEVILGVGKAIKRTTGDKIASVTKRVRKEMDHFKKTGRPKK
jgi:hypothetical protein